jgi:hypothetical protein
MTRGPIVVNGIVKDFNIRSRPVVAPNPEKNSGSPVVEQDVVVETDVL